MQTSRALPHYDKAIFPPNNFNELVFRAYDHNNVDKRYINKEAEEKIEENFDLGLPKPDQMIGNLRAQNVTDLRKQNTKYFLEKLRMSTGLQHLFKEKKNRLFPKKILHEFTL